MPLSSSGPASSTTRAARGEPIRGRPDEDLARAGGLLESGGEIDRLAGRERRLGVVDDDLTRLDPDPRLELELVHRFAHRERGASRALRVVLVRLRNAEGGHHGVAGELLDDAAVLRRRSAETVSKNRVDAAAHDLRIGAGDEPCRVDDVDEQHGCELALHA